MFDVGFQELIMVALVALLVVGPERLPKLVRTAGYWLGRGRRILGSVKAEIDREIKADELKEILRKQAASNPLTTILEDTVHLAGRSLNGGGLGSGTGVADPGASIKTVQTDAATASAAPVFAPVSAQNAPVPPAVPAEATSGPSPRA